ncbi:MAG: flippase [Candidatus Magasanikbacteria bacterium]|nr:flippase [Candidatus Magasanikbacteria bacterium]
MALSVTQNTSLYTAAAIAQKVISFLYFTIIARTIGVENTGAYFFAIAFTSIFVVVADFGFAPVLTREAARTPEATSRLLPTTLTTKIIGGFLTYGLVLLVSAALRYQPEQRFLIAISGLTMFFDNLHSAFYSVLRARRNLAYEGAGIIASQLITLGIGTAALLFRWPLVWLILAYTIPSALNLLYAALVVHWRLRVAVRLGFDQFQWQKLFRIALPFALSGIIVRLYNYSDTVLISKLLPKEALGWWSVPAKIINAIQFLPMAVAASVFPVMSNLWRRDQATVARIYERAFRYLLLVSLPVAGGLIAIAEPAVAAVYGPAYFPAVVPLQLVLVGLAASFLSVINGTLLNAADRQRTQTGILAIGLVFTVGSNLILLPRFGLFGAALTSASGSWLIWLLGWRAVRRVAPVAGRALFGRAMLIVGPAAAMSALSYWLFFYSHWQWLLVIPAAAVCYGAGILLTGALKIKEIRDFWQTLFSRRPELSVSSEI